MPLSRRCIVSFALLLAAAPLSALACSGQLHVEIEHSGVYTLDHAAIIAAQPTLADCASDDLVLTWRGEEVPIRVVDQGDGRFGAGDRIEWIGQQLHGPESWYDSFSINNVYLLGASAGPHARLVDALPAGSGTAALQRRLHMEQENLMIRLDQNQQKPGEEADVWQWAKMTQVDPQPFQVSIDLPDLAVRGHDVALSLNFRGLSEVIAPSAAQLAKPDDHAVEVRINGRVLQTLTWNSRDEVQHDLSVPAAWLKPHGNTFTLSVPKRTLPWDASSTLIDVVMFNWMEWQYQIAGDLDAGALPLTRTAATGATPLRLAFKGAGTPVLYGLDGVRRPGVADGDGHYRFAAAPADTELYPALDGQLAAPVALHAVQVNSWQQPAQPYDYLIVSHPSLIDAIQPLAQFHEQRGLKVAVLDVNDVYDTFNHGINHPQAIRNLVDQAWHHWPQPRPRFLLLVGDASFDIRHDTYDDGRYAKWTHMELMYPNAFGHIASASYATPPKKLGDRNLIPTWQFPSPEGQSASDNWFGAVDGDSWHPVVAVGRFPVVEPAEVSAIVTKTIDYITKPRMGQWRRDVMFITDEIDYFKVASDKIASALSEQGFTADKVYASPKESENAVHQDAIRNGIDDGRLLVHFIGHGGRYIWRTGPPDLQNNSDMFTLDDVSSLNNANNLPMVLSMTCYSAPFDNPSEDSIGERFLREPGKGAVAVFAASWRNTPSPQFSTNLINELLLPGATIGEAIVRAKHVERSRTLVEMYNLLGDPALVLERPRDSALLAVDPDPFKPGVLVDLRDPDFSGKVTVDWLDAKGVKLASSTYDADRPRFRLPLPVLAEGEPAQAHVYAANLTSGRDAVGGLDLKATAAPARPWREVAVDWWRELNRKPYQPPPLAPDTLSRSGFEVGEVAVTPAAQTAHGAD